MVCGGRLPEQRGQHRRRGGKGETGVKGQSRQALRGPGLVFELYSAWNTRPVARSVEVS